MDEQYEVSKQYERPVGSQYTVGTTSKGNPDTMMMTFDQ